VRGHLDAGVIDLDLLVRRDVVVDDHAFRSTNVISEPSWDKPVSDHGCAFFGKERYRLVTSSIPGLM